MDILENREGGCEERGCGRLPTFLIIGAMKAGTTSLYEYLRAHPEVFMPDMKEPDYFSKGIQRGRSLRWYVTLFEEAGRAKAVGEASTDYARFPIYGDVPARIADLLPEVQLIYVVRHPIERMRSQYVHEVAMGNETRPIDEALLADRGYLDPSRYAFQIQQFLAHFTRGQILIVTSENLRYARRPTLHRMLEFLDLSATWSSPALDVEFHGSAAKRRPHALNRTLGTVRRLHMYRTAASVAPSFVRSLNRRVMTRRIHQGRTVISDGLRRHLESLLSDDVRDLRLLVGRDFDGWGLA